MIRHPFTRTERFDMIKLRRALADRLGISVEVLTSEPSDDDPDGVLIVEDPETGEPLDVDPGLIAEVVRGIAEWPVLSIEERAAAQFDAARTTNDKLAAFRSYLADRIVAQEQSRERTQEIRRDLRRRIREQRQD